MKSLFASGAALLLCQGAWGEQWITNNMSGWWTGVASSADGVKLVAVTGESCCGKIYTSTDSGATWVARTTPEPGGAWAAVASSADGSRLVAVSYNGIRVCISQDSGVTWTTPLNPALFSYGPQFESVCSSGDGNLVLAGAIGFTGTNPTNRLYRSADGGTNWTLVDLGGRRVAALCCSGDGKTVFAGTKPDMWETTSLVYKSADSGLTWVPTTAPSAPWHALACSVDGTRVYATPNAGTSGGWYGVLYASHDWGVTWSSNAVPARSVSRMDCSADGSRIVLVDSGFQQIVSSVNAGASWTVDRILPALDDPFGNGVTLSADGNTLIVFSCSSVMYAAKTTPVPLLNIQPSAEGACVSWTVPSSRFALQESGQVSTGWTDVRIEPSLQPASLKYTVPVSVGPSSKFYRLIMR